MLLKYRTGLHSKKELGKTGSYFFPEGVLCESIDYKEWVKEVYSEPCQTSKMVCFAKI